MSRIFAQFRIVFNAKENKRLKGGWVQTAIDGGFDIPFKPKYFCNYYGYKKTELNTKLNGKQIVDIYDEVPRKVNSSDVVLIHKSFTFCFLRIDYNIVTKEGVRRNREMEEYWKEEEKKWQTEDKRDGEMRM